MLVHPVIALSCAAALAAGESPTGSGTDLSGAAVGGAELLKRFTQVSDGRSGQGRIHPVAVVLTLCAAAVLAGMRSFTAIAGWVADVPVEILSGLYAAPPVAHPSKSTLWRVLTGVDAAAVDAVIGAWLLDRATTVAAGSVAGVAYSSSEVDTDSGQEQPLVGVAVDGKTVRGAIDPEGNQVHLLGAATHGQQLVLGQVEVGAKTNEIPMFAPLLDRLAGVGADLSGLVVTADALHCQRGHAEDLHRRGAEFVFTVKHNQPGLFTALDALPWAQTPIADRQVDRGHGRVTTRTIQVRPAPDKLPFPHVNQVWLIERHVSTPTGTPISAVAALGVTSLSTQRATPTDLARFVREHWGIESLHWLRDSVYREDHSRARTGSGPHVMAALRNLAIGALHLLGRRDISEATRWAARCMDRPFQILGLTT